MEDFSPTHLAAMFRRHRTVFCIITSMVFALTALVALNWSRYRASATIEIEQAYVPSSITATGNAQDAALGLADRRIRQIEQKVTSIESLNEIITQLNLYPGRSKSASPAALAKAMREAININFISSAVSNPAIAAKESVEQLSAIAFTVSFDYNNPALTQKALDEIVNRFITEEARQRQHQASSTTAFLNEELAALQASIAEKERAIADFRTRHGESGPAIVSFNQQAIMSNTLNLQNVENQMTVNQATLGALRGQLAATDPYLPMEEDGKMVNSPASQLKLLQAQYASITGRYGPTHPDVIKLRDQISALRKSGVRATSTQTKRDADNPTYLQLAAQLAATESQQQALLAQRTALINQQSKYETAMAANPALEQQLSQLTLDLTNSTERFNDLKSKAAAATMKEKLENSDNSRRLRVLVPSLMPEDTTPPRKLLLIGAVALALFSGVGIVVLLELLQQRIRGTHHLSELLGIAPLIRIAHITPSVTQPLQAAPKVERNNAVTLDPAVLEAHHIIAHRTRSHHADQFRILRTQVLQLMTTGGMKTLGITSPNYGDGKTTTSLNLALSIALDLKQTVLLVDLDLRKPSMMECLGLTKAQGLSDYFTQAAPIEECILRPQFERLALLPAGRKLEHSSEALGSPKIAALAEELKNRYADRLIIYDLPPVLAQDDPLVFLPHMDGVLLVVNEGNTRAAELKSTLNILSHAHVIGTVLNDSRNRNAASA